MGQLVGWEQQPDEFINYEKISFLGKGSYGNVFLVKRRSDGLLFA